MALWILNSLWNWNLVVLKITLLPLVMLSRFFWPSSTPIIVQFTVLLLLDRTLGGCIFICPKNLLWNAHPGYHTFDFRVLTICLVLSFLEIFSPLSFHILLCWIHFLLFRCWGSNPTFLWRLSQTVQLPQYFRNLMYATLCGKRNYWLARKIPPGSFNKINR